MHKLKVLGVALVAVFAVAVATAASASAALPEAVLLSGEAFPRALEGTSGKGLLVTTGGSEIKCTKGKSAGSLTGAKTGTVTLTFEGCESSGFKCKTSTAPNAGEVISKGSTLLVFDSLSPLGVADLLAVEETTIECTALVKIKVKGNILLLILPVGEEVKLLTLHVSQTSGKPTDKKYWNNSTGVEESALLLTSVNGGAFQESGDTSEENHVNVKEMVTISG